MANLETGTRTVRKGPRQTFTVVADVAVVGSGAAGMSAALEAAALGKRVAVIEANDAPGGQAVGSMIGTFCGLYSNGPMPGRVTHGIADHLMADLRAQGTGSPRRARNTLIVDYDVPALGRWVEERFREAGVQLLLGSPVRQVHVEGSRIGRLDLASRWGDVSVEAGAVVDASGDAAVIWHAGLDLQEPEITLYDTLMFTLENVAVDVAESIPRPEIHARLREKGAGYGLVRHDGFVFVTQPDQGIALVNMTHLSVPKDPVGASRALLDGRRQVDDLVRFLRAEFPGAYGAARVRQYGLPGIRQTRWIKGRHHMTADEVRSGHRYADAVARCSWPIEFHHRVDDVHWEIFGDDHMHYVPLSSMTPVGLDNVVAAGRCIDADAAALASVRVMGPCMAMGRAAVHALDLAGSGSVHQVDIATLQGRIADNIEGSSPSTGAGGDWEALPPLP